LASAALARPLPSETVVFGEIGLAGEVRAVARADARLKEAAKLGFGSAIVPPRRGAGAAANPRLIEIGHVGDLLSLLRQPSAAAAGERRSGRA
jgi:DNA repair protein RadA/Sms